MCAYSGSSTTESAPAVGPVAADTAGGRRTSFGGAADLISVYSEYLEDPSTAAAVAAADRAAKTAAKAHQALFLAQFLKFSKYRQFT